MPEPSSAPDALPRVPTHIPGLDLILNGGLLEGGLYLVLGTPGTGKTILCNQIAFKHVASGERAVYVTLIAETHARMLAHLRPLAFFDPAPISDTLYYISGYPALEQEGLDGLLSMLRSTVRDHRATLLIIDGIVNIHPRADILGYKRFMQDLQVTMEANGCTTILISPSGNVFEPSPEHTIVDGIIALSHQRAGMRAVRELEIRKFRGSGFLEGSHSIEIGKDGVVVHPRTEARYAFPPAWAGEERQRMSFGIPSLDEMVQGGLLSGSTTMLLGAPGSGKTSLGLHFLADGARQGQPGLHFGFYETPPRLASKANQISLDFARHVEEGTIEVIWQPPLENNLDALAEKLLAAVHRRKVKRLFLDGVNAFKEVAYPDRLGRYFIALTNELRALDVTTVYTSEWPALLAPAAELPDGAMVDMAENMILLRYVELRSQLYRLLSIIKVRESDYDPSIREFRITSKGIEVASTFESAEAILTGTARPSPTPSTFPHSGRRSSGARGGKRGVP